MRSSRSCAILVAAVLAFAGCSSSGTSAGTVVVPNLVGMSATKAKAGLVAFGLTVGTATRVRAAKPSGVVLAQSPPAGESAPKGDTVTFTVSAGTGKRPQPKARPQPAQSPTTVANTPTTCAPVPTNPDPGALTPEQIRHIYNVGMGRGC